jgi:dipeptidyl aminopeptidase/acylaminoacyl peptidase
MPVAGVAQQTAKKALDHSVYDSWKAIRNTTLSRDGKWLVYSINPQVGDGTLFIASTEGKTTHQVERGTSPRFSHDSRFVVVTVNPSREETEKARRERRRPQDMPRNSMTIVNLANGQMATVERVRSIRFPEEDSGWFAYQLEAAQGAQGDAPAQAGTPAAGMRGGTGVRGAGQAQPQAPAEERTQASDTGKKRDHAVGNELILRNLDTGEERKVPEVSEYTFSKDGKRLAYALSTKDGKGDGVFIMTLADGKATPVLTGLGRYSNLTLSDATGALAFLTDRDDYKADQAAYALYLFRPGAKEAVVVAQEDGKGAPSGWWMARRSPSFSESGNRLFFYTQPRPAAPQRDETPEDERVNVDIWHWEDPELQTMQLLRADAERNRSYQAIYDVKTGRILQLETLEVPSATIGSKGDADVAIGTSNLPYRQLVSWDTSYNDIYLINLRDASRKKVLEQNRGSASLSPSSRYAVWYDAAEQKWYSMDTATGKTVELSRGIPHALQNELHDQPSLPGSYGSGGWLQDERAFLIYDSHDIWACDPTGQRAPYSLTDGWGRRRDMRLRINRLEREEDTIDASKPLLLNVFNMRTRASGFYRLMPDRRMVELAMADARFGAPTKAQDADVVVLTRETFTDFPDLWLTTTEFKDMKRVTEANPQQKDYNWGTAEIVTWQSLQGQPLEGILYRPENFDYGKKYPMIVYFYERLSEGLHTHRAPAPGSSSINPTFYTSRGYLVFMPDIPYRIGYPGQSAVSAILPGVNSIVSRGIVDPARIGMQGHSWGGYQVCYLVTQTDMFRAAVAGAPVSNMTSAYGGIRWGSGMVRQFQYEKTQSRIGGSLWERPLQYLENSPVFWADKINTPLLILHNDQDDAVPWYQGIELFTALRRLQRPAWMLNYNGELHGIRRRANQVDWATRMQQFFDHYLKDEPAPKWLAEGIPAIDKGRDLGLDPSRRGR